MKAYCESCDGRGYSEHPDYDWDENLLDEGIRVECMDCNGNGYIDRSKKVLERLASFITRFDIDGNICKKHCKFTKENEYDVYDCVDCIINLFSSSCKWEQDGICVNDKSAWCADFVDSVKCGRCDYYSVE